MIVSASNRLNVGFNGGDVRTAPYVSQRLGSSRD